MAFSARLTASNPSAIAFNSYSRHPFSVARASNFRVNGEEDNGDFSSAYHLENHTYGLDTVKSQAGAGSKSTSSSDVMKLFNDVQQNMLFLNKQRIDALDDLHKVERERELLLAKLSLLETEVEATASERDVLKRELQDSKQIAGRGMQGGKGNSGIEGYVVPLSIFSELLLRIDSMVLTGAINVGQAGLLKSLALKQDAQAANVFSLLRPKGDKELASGLLPLLDPNRRQVLKTENKCFICEQTGHYANNSPQKKRPADSEDKEDRKRKRPMVGLVPDMVGDKPNSDASELCRAWGKVRDQTVLIFFDPGAKANFISPELASRLGIRSEEMGYTAEAGLACPGHTEAVTPIIGKLRLHIQSYVDAEEFYIMPLDGCDVLLGIPWLFRVQGILDAYNKKITVQSRGKTLILDVKLKGESIPTVSASAISSVMKKHLSAYLVFAREVPDCDESNLSVLDKEI
ncbi:hypothetical protein L7F22_051559 [Adiantum nelumboides]|nr:hypothetical protein [Adiantum nelumboides]